MAKAPIQVVWFKRDLRIHDHAPLSNAAAAGSVLPVFAIEPGQWQAPDSALRHWQFAADSLVDLSHALETLGLPLCIWQGDIIDLLNALKTNYGEFALHSHEETGNAWSFVRDLSVKAWCQQHGAPSPGRCPKACNSGLVSSLENTTRGPTTLKPKRATGKRCCMSSVVRRKPEKPAKPLWISSSASGGHPLSALKKQSPPIASSFRCLTRAGFVMLKRY